MEKMIDNMIEIGGAKTALRMEWIRLAYNETNDFDEAFTRIFALQKGDN